MALFAASFVGAPYPAIARGAPGSVVIVGVPGLRASDLTSTHLPALRDLAARSAVGWMNCRVARTAPRDDQGEAAAWVTLGAGARAAAPPNVGVMEADSLARVVASVKLANTHLDHRVPVGALGDLVHRAGLETSVAGDEDALRPERASWLMVADSRGSVDVAADLARDASAHARLEPYGRITPPALLRPRASASLSLLVFGDLARANRYESLCTPKAAAAMRERALRRLDDTLRGVLLLDAGQPGSALIVLSPAADPAAGPVDRLAPVLVCARALPPGLLTSGSTRTPGLIANTDVLPTIASLLALRPPPGLVGRAARSTGTGPVVAEGWRRLHDRWLDRARLQSLIGGLPSVQGLLVGIAVVGWWRRQARWERAARCCSGMVLVLPVVGMVAPVLGVYSLAASIGILAIVCIAAGVACYHSTLGAHTVLGATTACCLLTCIAALVLRRGWFAIAWPSYSLMEGARYYGIGNEYAAALGGCLLIVLALASRARGRVHVAVACGAAMGGLAVAGLVGHPGFGANAGGAAGIALGSVVLGVALRRDHVRVRDVALAVCAVAAVIGLALLADVLRAVGDQSHIARALTESDGPVGIALRKAAMNLWLLAHSPWAPLLAAGFGGLAVLGWHGKRERDPRAWWAARAAIFWLAVGVFALNDSGVVAGAECLGIGVSALGLWAAVPRLDTEGPVSVN